MDMVIGNSKRIFWLQTFVMAISLSQSLTIIEQPSNATSMIGEDVLLKCVTSEDGGERDYLEWVEFITNRAEPRRIWLSDSDPGNITRPDKYEIEGEYNLRIKGVNIEDGGKYGCKLIVQSDSYYTAHVTVFETVVCDAEGEDLHEYDMGYISCHVTYGGTAPPDVHFYDSVSGEQLQIDYSRGENEVYISANISTTYEDDKKPFNCVVDLVFHPDYRDNCTAVLNVTYTVRNLYISPVEPNYYVGDEIICNAVGNPYPDIWWDNLGSPDIILVRINDTSLVITEDMIGFNVWNCTAENTVLDNTTQLLQRITFHAWPAPDPNVCDGMKSNIILLFITLLICTAKSGMFQFELFIQMTDIL